MKETLPCPAGPTLLSPGQLAGLAPVLPHSQKEIVELDHTYAEGRPLSYRCVFERGILPLVDSADAVEGHPAPVDRMAPPEPARSRLSSG